MLFRSLLCILFWFLMIIFGWSENKRKGLHWSFFVFWVVIWTIFVIWIALYFKKEFNQQKKDNQKK